MTQLYLLFHIFEQEVIKNKNSCLYSSSAGKGWFAEFNFFLHISQHETPQCQGIKAQIHNTGVRLTTWLCVWNIYIACTFFSLFKKRIQFIGLRDFWVWCLLMVACLPVALKRNTDVHDRSDFLKSHLRQCKVILKKRVSRPQLLSWAVKQQRSLWKNTETETLHGSFLLKTISKTNNDDVQFFLCKFEDSYGFFSLVLVNRT